MTTDLGPSRARRAAGAKPPPSQPFPRGRPVAGAAPSPQGKGKRKRSGGAAERGRGGAGGCSAGTAAPEHPHPRASFPFGAPSSPPEYLIPEASSSSEHHSSSRSILPREHRPHRRIPCPAVARGKRLLLPVPGHPPRAQGRWGALGAGEGSE